MMTTLRRLATLIPMILIVSAAEATAQQGQAVTGRVVNAETLAPLGGVLVSVDGANTATLTAQDGRYSIQAPATATLVFSMLGYSQRREPVQSRSVIDIGMQSAAIALDELVAVGYGQQTRATVSGSVSTVDTERLNTTAFSSASTALAGTVQGISVRATTTGAFGIARSGGGLANQVVGDPVDGRPGAAAVLQIRNMGDPLFVIDGIPQDDPQAFNNLNSADIESISILKDASAAVYGFRAANGVVLVTTRRGTREQAPRISVNGAYGWQNLTRYHYMRMYDAYDHLWNLADSNANLGLNNNLTDNERAEGRALLENWRQGGPGFESTDHYALAVNNPNAPQYNLNTSVTGGTESAQYYLSLGHVQQDYNMQDFTWGRTNMAANLSVNLSEGFRIGTELRAQQGVTDGVAILGDTDPIRHLLFTVNSSWPFEQPLIGPNKEYINFNVRRLDRSVGMLGRDQTGWTQDVRREARGNFWAEYTLPFGTVFRGTVSPGIDLREYDMARRTWNAYCQDPVTDAYSVCFNSGDRTRQQLQNTRQSIFGSLTASHSQTFGEHSLSGSAFMEMDGSETEQTLLIGQSPTDYTHIIEQARITGVQNDWDIERRSSVGGRINYDYQQKYMLEVLGRYDGTYLYAPGQRWGFFPGVSAAWRITEESFMQDRLGFLEDLKLRASWGQTGREQGVGPWGFLTGATYGQGNGSVFDGTFVTGARPRGLAVTNLTWVTSTMKNIGFDALLFDGRVSIEADMFERGLSGLPAARNDILLPDEVGYNLPNENLNRDVTRGFEVGATWNDRIGELTYSISPNFTIARSRPEFRHFQRFGSSWARYTNTGAVGRWSGANFGYETIGQFQTIEEIESHEVLQNGQDNRSLLPGDLIFKDQNGDGIINGMDQRPIGFAEAQTPIVSYGGTTRFGYGGVALAINFSGGAYFSHTRDFEMRFQGWGGHNGPAYGMDRWRRLDPYDPQSEWVPGRYPPIRVNRTGGLYPSTNNTSDFWRTNVKFLRVRSVELGYDIPDRLPASVGLSGVRIFTNLSNPFSIDNTRHYNMDPEVVQNNGQTYPSIRLLNLGFSANVGGGPRAAVPVAN